MPTDRRPSYFRHIGAVATTTLAIVAALVCAAGTAAAAPTTRVSNADIAPVCPAVTTGYCTELHGAGTAAVVDDNRANAGRSYLRLTTLAPADHATVYAERFNGMRLADISDLAFETFVEQAAAGNDQVTPAINIPIKPNKVGVASTFTTLVWEPIYTGAKVQANSWQHWTPSEGKGGWWATEPNVVGGKPNTFGFTNYISSFADVKLALPDATVYAVAANQGSGVTGLVAGVDQLRVNGTTFDFENPLPTAELGVQIKAPASAKPGTSFQATVRVTNAGTAPARIISTALMLGAGVKVTNAPGGIGLGGVAAYRTTELAAGRSVEFVVTLAVDAGAHKPLMLFAATHSLVPDLNAQNNATQVSVPLA